MTQTLQTSHKKKFIVEFKPVILFFESTAISLQKKMYFCSFKQLILNQVKPNRKAS